MSLAQTTGAADHNLTYLALRGTVGWIGIELPVLLVT